MSLIDEQDRLAAGQGQLRVLADDSSDNGVPLFIVGDGQLLQLLIVQRGLLIQIALDLGMGGVFVQGQVIAQIQIVVLVVPDGGALGIHALDGHLGGGVLSLSQSADAHGGHHGQGQEQSKQLLSKLHFKITSSWSPLPSRGQWGKT